MRGNLHKLTFTQYFAPAFSENTGFTEEWERWKSERRSRLRRAWFRERMDPNEVLPDVGIEDLASDASGEFLENFKYLVGLLIQWIASGKKIKKDLSHG